MARRVILACGILSSVLYVATDIVATLRYEGYSYTSQGVSELNAVGAPTRPFTLPLFTIYDVLLLVFGAGVWVLADRNRALRITGAMLAADAVAGQIGLQFFDMDPRVAGRTARTILHARATAVEVLVILLAIGFGAAALGKRFRLYSIGTLLTALVFGAVAGLLVARSTVPSQPTPWLGITERINIYAYMLWKVMLAIALLRVQKTMVPIAVATSENSGR